MIENAPPSFPNFLLTLYMRPPSSQVLDVLFPPPLFRPIHHSRDVPSQFLLSPRGQQLTALQNLIQSFMERKSPITQFVRVDSSVNLERCLELGSSSADAGFGFGQLSVGYIMNAIRHHEENKAGGGELDSRSNRCVANSKVYFIFY
jgi:hypothetical protein